MLNLESQVSGIEYVEGKLCLHVKYNFQGVHKDTSD